MNWNDQGEIENAGAVIKTLLEIATSDGDFNEREIMYILQVGEKMGLHKDTMEQVIRDRHKITFTPPQSEEERMTFLYYALFLIKVDQKISQEEKSLYYKIGFRLGFRQLLLEDLLIVMEENLNKRVPPEALIEKIRKYLN
jgi:hypothetical protein